MQKEMSQVYFNVLPKHLPRGTEGCIDQDKWPLGREFNQGLLRYEDGGLTSGPLCSVLSITTNKLACFGTYVITTAEEELDTRK
jgi:hypothetical protein